MGKNEMRFKYASVFAAAALALSMGSGCATSRGVLDVQTPEVPDPASQSVVVITKVTDSRVFELQPGLPSVPSLKDGQIGNPEITSRAIARKRNAYGKALGDVLLPEGRTVEDVVRESLERALREKGYSVIGPRNSAASSAIPLEAEILQYWAWFTPGFWAASLEFEVILLIESPIFENTGDEGVRGYVKLSTQAATGGAWLNTINKGTDDLVAQIKDRLAEP